MLAERRNVDNRKVLDIAEELLCLGFKRPRMPSTVHDHCRATLNFVARLQPNGGGESERLQARGIV